MSWNSTWIGLAGGGFGVSAIVGASYYVVSLVNMVHWNQRLDVAVFGRRLGITLHAEATHAFCFMTGVPDANRFEQMSSSGIDWGAGYGVNIANAVRSNSQALDALVELAARGVARRARTAIEGVAWVGSETAKNAVRAVMGDITADTNAQNFVLIPTPASLAIGAGIWYEWSDVMRIGLNLIWRREPPDWCLDMRTGTVVLRMRNIPESDGSHIRLVIPVNMWFSDDLIEWQQGVRGRSNRIDGIVFGGVLYPVGTRTPNSGQDGINLSEWVPSGRNEINMLSSTGRNSEIVRNDTMEIGVNVMEGAVTRWSSDDYVEVRTNAEGRITQRLGTGDWRD